MHRLINVNIAEIKAFEVSLIDLLKAVVEFSEGTFFLFFGLALNWSLSLLS